MNRSALGRADLIRWAASLDEARLERLAETLGYQKLADQVVGVSSPIGAVRVVAKVGEAPPATAASRHRQYRVVERHVLAPLPDQPEPPPTPAPEPPAVPLGPPPPLIPWSRLWPFLRAALGELAERNRIDLPRLMSACSRVRPLRRLPRLKGQRWAPKGQLILDLSRRLYPFWNDFNTLKAALPRLRGENGLEILRMDQGPASPVQPWESGAWGPPRPYVPPAAGIPVLIVGDVGCLGTSAERQAWVRLGRRLAGTGRVPVVLTPCPSRWWDRVLSGLYFPVVLDRRSHLPPRPTGPRPWPARPVDLAQAVQEDPGARLLLTLLSACVAIRPALLRHLRHRLPADLADAGSEAAAWQHPAFIAGDFELLPGDPVPLGYLRLAFHQTGSDAERQLAWDLIRAQQALGATRSRCMEERSLHAVMNGRSDPAAELFLDELAGAMDQADQRNDPEHARSLAALVNRRAEHMHPEGWRQSPRLEALWLKANPRAEEDGAVLPLGYEIRRALAVAGRPERPQDWRLVQRGDGLEFEPLSVTEGPLTGARPLLERSSTRRPIVQVQENRSGAPESSLPLGDGLALPLTESGWRLRTDFEELVIAPLERPAWAHTLGRDGDGLFVGFRDGQGERRAYWCAPLEWLEWPGSPTRPEASPWDGHGGFIDEDQYQALRSLGLASEGDGLSLHSDGFGLRAEIEIKGVPIGLRWIWPGA